MAGRLFAERPSGSGGLSPQSTGFGLITGRPTVGPVLLGLAAVLPCPALPCLRWAPHPSIFRLFLFRALFPSLSLLFFLLSSSLFPSFSAASSWFLSVGTTRPYPSPPFPSPPPLFVCSLSSRKGRSWFAELSCILRVPLSQELSRFFQVCFFRCRFESLRNVRRTSSFLATSQKK